MGNIVRADFTPGKSPKKTGGKVASEGVQKGVITVGKTEVLKPKTKVDWFSVFFWVMVAGILVMAIWSKS